MEKLNFDGILDMNDKDKEFLYERVLIAMFLENFDKYIGNACMIFNEITLQVDQMFEALDFAFDMPTQELVQEIIFKTIQGKLNNGK